MYFVYIQVARVPRIIQTVGWKATTSLLGEPSGEVSLLKPEWGYGRRWQVEGGGWLARWLTGWMADRLTQYGWLADRLAKYGATLERNAFRYHFLLLFTALEVAVAQTVWE